MKIRSYNELMKLKTFVERYEYLRLNDIVGHSAFGFNRYINQNLYHSNRWRRIRDEIIVRDNGCDLAVPGYEITDKIVIHHMNPISLREIEEGDEIVFNLDVLICTSYRTHLAIHYGDKSLPKPLVVRHSGDTKLW